MTIYYKGASGGGGDDPHTVSGTPIFIYDFSSNGFVFEDTGRTDTVEDADGILGLEDQGSVGWDFGDASSLLTWTDAAQNSLGGSISSSSGSGDGLVYTHGSDQDETELTIAVVGQLSSEVAGCVVFEIKDVSGDDIIRFESVYADSDVSAVVTLNNGGDNLVGADLDAGDQFYIYILTLTTGNAQALYVNGDSSADDTATETMGTMDIRTLEIQNSGESTIGEIIVWDEAKDSSARADIFSALNTKWAVY